MEDNKLIAEFMGVEHVKMFRRASSQHTFDGVQYHISWDWLMPVVDRIEDYLSDNVGKVGYFDECLSSNNLDVRYQAVVEFIKTYNDGR